MRSLNPDGSVVEGGQLAIKEIPKQGLLSGLFNKTQKVLTFYDSNSLDKENLKWVWYKGIMVNLCPQFVIAPQEVLRQNLLSAAILNMHF